MDRALLIIQVTGVYFWTHTNGLLLKPPIHFIQFKQMEFYGGTLASAFLQLFLAEH